MKHRVLSLIALVTAALGAGLGVACSGGDEGTGSGETPDPSSGGGGTGGSGGEGPVAKECTVSDALIPETTDFWERVQIAVGATGEGSVLYSTNGTSTGAHVYGVHYVPLGAGARPQGETAAQKSGSLMHDVFRLDDGSLRLATASSSNPGVQLHWLSPMGAWQRTETLQTSNSDYMPTVLHHGDVTYLAWIRRSHSPQDEEASLWIAGYTSQGEAFPPTKLLGDLTEMSVNWVSTPTSAHLVWSGVGGEGEVLRWASVSPDGALGPTVTASEHAPGHTVVLQGDELAVGYTTMTEAPPSIASRIVLVSFDFATGATRARYTSATDDQRAPALATRDGKYALAFISAASSLGGVHYLQLSRSFEVERQVVVRPTGIGASAIFYNHAVDLAVHGTSTYLAYGDDNRQIHVAHVDCSD
ncbi:hypothetical protein [Chondromyces crocatus]|uniref:Lipoprotein n=1 Tax=Chondromyces crocatus TaxID=52 RepID=A0A0K1EM86_CHOCO|nr:hypothetical protein [Chondromyces crocatus]AKT42020.1 uncharacterized protein CMC5_062420 [Chondromyces crocatus]